MSESESSYESVSQDWSSWFLDILKIWALHCLCMVTATRFLHTVLALKANTMSTTSHHGHMDPTWTPWITGGKVLFLTWICFCCTSSAWQLYIITSVSIRCMSPMVMQWSSLGISTWACLKYRPNKLSKSARQPGSGIFISNHEFQCDNSTVYSRCTSIREDVRRMNQMTRPLLCYKWTFWRALEL